MMDIHFWSDETTEQKIVMVGNYRLINPPPLTDADIAKLLSRHTFKFKLSSHDDKAGETVVNQQVVSRSSSSLSEYNHSLSEGGNHG